MKRVFYLVIIFTSLIIFGSLSLSGQVFGESGEKEKIFIKMNGNLLNQPDPFKIEKWFTDQSEMSVEGWIRIVPKFFVGLGVGLINIKWNPIRTTSIIPFEEPYPTSVFPKIDSMTRHVTMRSTIFPISLLCSFTALESKSLKFYLTAGLDLFLGRIRLEEEIISSRTIDTSDPDMPIYSYYYYADNKANINKLSGRFGIGGELKLTSRFSVTIDLILRKGNIKNVTGKKEWIEEKRKNGVIFEQNSNLSSDQILWHGKEEYPPSWDTKGSFETVTFQQTSPDWLTEVHPLNFKIDGFILMFGIKIKIK